MNQWVGKLPRSTQVLNQIRKKISILSAALSTKTVQYIILLSFLFLLYKFLQQSCATVTVYSCQIDYSMSILLVFIPVNKPC